MAVFDICAAVTVAPGGSFQWNNSKSAAVKLTPVTSWPLPSNEYDIAAGATTAAINIPGSTLPNTTYQVNVKWLSSGTPGIPCTASGANPRIVVSQGR